MLKARDASVERVILGLADSQRNRRLMRSAGEHLRATFPLQGRSAVAAVRSTADPGCNLLLAV